MGAFLEEYLVSKLIILIVYQLNMLCSLHILTEYIAPQYSAQFIKQCTEDIATVGVKVVQSGLNNTEPGFKFALA